MIDIIITVILIFIVAWALIFIISRKKKGECIGCSCSSSCNGSCKKAHDIIEGKRM